MKQLIKPLFLTIIEVNSPSLTNINHSWTTTNPPFFGISHPEITTSRHLEREREERDASEMQKEAVMAAQLEAIGDSPKNWRVYSIP